MKEGSFVILHLTDPMERHWGRLISIDQAGLVVRCIELGQVELYRYQFKHEERSIFPQTLFFPMRRVMKLALDEPVENIPSVIEDLISFTGLKEDEIIA